jgi:RND superfamily putative drug exporter
MTRSVTKRDSQGLGCSSALVAGAAIFGGLSNSALMVVVHSPSRTASDPAFRATLSRVERLLRTDRHVASLMPPRAGSTISADGHTAIITAGANGDPTAMVAAADTLKSKLKRAGTEGVGVSLTGASGSLPRRACSRS